VSQQAKIAIAAYLCGSVPCEHHLDLGARFLKMVTDAQMRDREQMAKEALDRIVEKYEQKIR
jgi:hypothetical protein